MTRDPSDDVATLRLHDVRSLTIGQLLGLNLDEGDLREVAERVHLEATRSSRTKATCSNQQLGNGDLTDGVRSEPPAQHES